MLTTTQPLNQVFEDYKHRQITLTILGSGAWGSALAHIANVNGHTVRMWSRSSDLSLKDAVDGAEVIMSAISMKGVPELVNRLKGLNIPETTVFVTATKGLDPETTLTPSVIFQRAFPHHAVAVLSGPNLSKEIEAGLPAATVIACENETAAEAVQHVFAGDNFRTYSSTDPLGAELGGTLKNVIAIAVGVCEGLKLGSNARSALITRALPEVMRIGTHLGGQPETFLGLSGLGDMLATCTSILSRNYRVGYGLAKGQKLEQILAELGSTAEGVNTAYVLHDIAQREQISIPISQQVYLLLKGEISAEEAVAALMERKLKAEDYQEILQSEG
ncbi:NAD(P)H-dependent glycerol-3-phosphate dehydrogenase [Leptolyngbya sp. CCNP1308]|uniref:NAD(P)H-dependent glycerol-3-phosphate dehydrogenase n=1 Tax=Leptolyngbya sp. CCNP1308 TaxID=3110255 RepID=UPI002B2211E0|nr:NAD(P)H-dependent glycerol-3-phosphate dehydrogenase [Leptolyngbya sp. CCNP1308]MEA5449306.1 NAD(P)H-dependent glycerol-3-phosphate dehydrogenase [Leptolyngbya sp. CCNP1308]